MQISQDYIVVEKVEEEKKGEFQTVQIQDSSTYKGRIKQISVVIPGLEAKVGDVVLFAKYSPDTHDIEIEGEKLKFVKINDVLAIL